MAWTGTVPILAGMAAVAFAANSMCKNSDKRTSGYQVAVAVLFVGILCAFSGILMMGTGMGLGLFSMGLRPGGAGYGGGYGGGYY